MWLAGLLTEVVDQRVVGERLGHLFLEAALGAVVGGVELDEGEAGLLAHQRGRRRLTDARWSRQQRRAVPRPVVLEAVN